jgi:hypothetical protein
MATVSISSGPFSTVLQIAQAFAREYSQPIPPSLSGSSDAGYLQLLEMIQSVGEFCLEETNWDFSKRDAVWSSVVGQDQGALDTLFPDGFTALVRDTLWDRTEMECIPGPIEDAERASYQAGFVSPHKRCWVKERRLYVWPSMEAGHTLAASYKSSHWLVSSAGVSKDQITEDADKPLFPRTVMKLGLAFYWKRAKELPYTLEEDRFLEALAAAGSRNVLRPVVHMDNEAPHPRPGIVVPLTNWGQ